MTWTQPPQIDALQNRVSQLILNGETDRADAIMREACLHPVFGLWVLLRYGLGRQDAHNQWVFDRCREVQASPDGHLDLWAREHYKALDVETPIWTAGGWKRHGDLRFGDKVFAPDGRIVRVIANTGPMEGADCFDVAGVVAAGDHLWPVQVKHRARVVGGRDVWFSTTIQNTREMGRARLPNILPIDGAGELPVPPYVLGVWLGDGHVGCSRVTSGDDQLWGLLGWPTTGSGILRNLTMLAPALRSIGVLKDKHVPQAYLGAEVRDRLALLQGLMDTDGHVNERGTATFVNTNERLADAAYHLATSLGMRCHKRRYENDHAGYWQVSFQARSGTYCPFRLARKRDRCRFDSIKLRMVEPRAVETRTVNCIQVEGGLYLAGRDLLPTHNSTVITFAKTIQDILANPEITIGIFSHTRPIAKAFLRQIKGEFERNERLKRWFPDILWADPAKESPKWSEDEGIVVKRKGNPKEATVEAWGVVDGQPTSKHFDILDFDDVVVPASVSTPEMMAKTTASLELAFNLGKRGGKRRFVGTRYHYNDSYRTIMDRQVASLRLYPATVDGTVDGEPVLLTRDELADKRRDQGPYTFGCQMLLDPTADDKQGFKEEWIRYAAVTTRGHNLVILIDPASSKKKHSDYTAGWVIGLGPDRKVYVHDMLRDRLSLTERASLLMAWHRKYQPIAVGYEQYGMQADIEHIRDLQDRENYRFDISPLGGAMAKNDRIRRLIPWFEQGRIYLHPAINKTDYERRSVDLTKSFINDEYRAFPVAAHDDMLDALARFLDDDLPIRFPAPLPEEDDRELEMVGGRNKTTGY